ncbi:hypothetical protein PUND_a3002 [Pseudoalteromonas undina]|nr:hypothetical protein PUND_a3002 [Pseudoalteromonas undina]
MPWGVFTLFITTLLNRLKINIKKPRHIKCDEAGILTKFNQFGY